MWQIRSYRQCIVQNLVDSAKRTAKPLVKKKDPVTSDILIKLCSMFLNSKDLLIISDLAMNLLSFSGFLRFNKLSQLRGNDVKVVSRVSLLVRQGVWGPFWSQHVQGIALGRGAGGKGPHEAPALFEIAGVLAMQMLIHM